MVLHSEKIHTLLYPNEKRFEFEYIGHIFRVEDRLNIADIIF